MIPPVLILPVQYHDTRDMRPEWRLVAAVLEQAISDFRGVGGESAARATEIQAGASQWLRARDLDTAFSFAWICAMLDVDPDATEAAIRSGRAIVLRRCGANIGRPQAPQVTRRRAIHESRKRWAP